MDFLDRLASSEYIQSEAGLELELMMGLIAACGAGSLFILIIFIVWNKKRSVELGELRQRVKELSAYIEGKDNEIKVLTEQRDGYIDKLKSAIEWMSENSDRRD